jgi:dTDP-4-amino-4,6-dideoxygalactose transaminase
MKIPILDLTRQYHAIQEEIDTAIRRVLESGRFILGPEVEAFEAEIAKYLGVKHAIGVASGTDALLLSLKALNIGPGDGVIVPSFTFFATAGVVANLGATPIFVDIDPKTFNIDPEKLRELLTNPSSPIPHPSPSTTFSVTRHSSPVTVIKAIIPVHLYGQPADMDEIMAIAHEHDLYVVEDAAQAIGAEYKGQKVGTIGHLGCFSFFPTKNLGAYGDGGLVVTNDDELAERVRMLRVHGSKPKYYHHMVGTNSRLDALQAAILRAKLPHLAEWTAARTRLADRYDELLGGFDGLVLPYRAPNRTHIFHQYTIRVLAGKRDALRTFSRREELAPRFTILFLSTFNPASAIWAIKRVIFPKANGHAARFSPFPCFPSLPMRSRIM